MGNFAENLNLGNRFRPPLAVNICALAGVQGEEPPEAHLMQFHNKFSYHAVHLRLHPPSRGPGRGAPGSSWVLAIQKPKKTRLWG